MSSPEPKNGGLAPSCVCIYMLASIVVINYCNILRRLCVCYQVWLAQAYSQLRELSVSSGKDKPGEMFGHISKESASWLQAGTPNKNSKVTSTLKPAPLKETSNSNNSSRTSGSGRLNLFSHISSRKDDWLLNEVRDG